MHLPRAWLRSLGREKSLKPLILGFLVLTIAIIVGLLIVGSVIVGNMANQREEEALASLADTMASKTEGLLAQMNYAFSIMESWLLSHPGADPRSNLEFEGYVRTFRASMGYLIDVGVLSRNGDLWPVPSVSAGPVAKATGKAYFLRQLDTATRGFNVGDLVRNEADGAWSIPVSYPLSSDHAGIFLIVGFIDLARFGSVYGNFSPDRGRGVALFHSDGRYLASEPFDQAYLGLSLKMPSTVALNGVATLGHSIIRREKGFDGREKLVAYHSVDYNHLVLAVFSDEDRILEKWRSFAPFLALGIVLVLAFLLFLSSRIYYLLSELDTARKGLEASVQGLEASQAAKDKLFSVVSHDLRGPLGGIRNLLETLVEERPRMGAKDLDQSLVALHEAADSTYSLLEDLLAWFRSQGSGLVFRPKTMALIGLVEEAFQAAQAQAGSKSVRLEMAIEEGCPVYADGDMLATILRNLVSNGIKYSRPGERLLVEASGSGDGTAITVRDEGLGMDERTRERLFDPGSLRSQPGSAGEKGTGLGLRVVKDFVERHGGRLEVESSPGKGSAFHVFLPRDPEPRKDLAQARPSILPRRPR
jgi:signal transduction histidine kinase